MIKRETWRTFRQTGLLWWVNRGLHLFGWAIVLQIEDDGEATEAFPARVSFRGFSSQDEAEGFTKLTEHLKSQFTEGKKNAKESRKTDL
jgi:hypothetical protein